ncbi:MAG: dihydropteroate synthase [Thermodesulfobacteriota bacterium]|nr:dihydropteroate synthase [Thermodesulfobacteriota bacterium]
MNGRVAWNVRGGRVIGPAPFLVAGVVNVTPDSFYDGGRYLEARTATAHARELLHQGADILDVGGESSRPFAEPVSPQEELDRVLPVIRAASKLSQNTEPVAVSVDTYKAKVAQAALDAGAVIVNDISACRFDPGLMDVLSHYKPGYVLMHSLSKPKDMQRSPKYTDVISEISAFFEERLGTLTKSGVPEQNIVLDPGFGFGKTLKHNLSIFQNIEKFTAFGRPLFIGLSNKSIWGALLELEAHERQNATQAATAIMAARGVKIHRVHEVGPTVQTLRVVQGLMPPQARAPEQGTEQAYV